MTDFVTKLNTYFHTFDGTRKSLEESQPVIDDVIDHHIVYCSPKGDILYPQYLERVRVLLEEGCKVDVLEMKTHEKGVEYRVRFTTTDNVTHDIHSIGVVDHGKLVRVEPVANAEAYNALFGDPNAD